VSTNAWRVRAQTQDRTYSSVSCSAEALGDARLMPQHRAVLQYWDVKRAGDKAPRRRDIDPTEIPKSLRHLALWEVEGNGAYRCRLSGGEIDRAMGGSLRGVLLHEIDCPCIEEARHEFDAVRDHALVSFSERTLGWAGRPYAYYRHLLLPLLDECRDVRRLLSVLTFHSIAEAPARA
jgi:hypothetical protein